MRVVRLETSGLGQVCGVIVITIGCEYKVCVYIYLCYDRVVRRDVVNRV